MERLSLGGFGDGVERGCMEGESRHENADPPN